MEFIPAFVASNRFNPEKTVAVLDRARVREVAEVIFDELYGDEGSFWMDAERVYPRGWGAVKAQDPWFEVRRCSPAVLVAEFDQDPGERRFNIVERALDLVQRGLPPAEDPVES